MNTLIYFFVGYGLFLVALFSYMRRLDIKQNEIKEMIQKLKDAAQ